MLKEKLYIIIDNKKVEFTEEVIKGLDDKDFTDFLNFLKSNIDKIFNPYSKEELIIKSQKWIEYKRELLGYFNDLFLTAYSDMFDRTFQFTNDDIVNIKNQFSNLFEEKRVVLNNIQVRILPERKAI